MAEQPSGIDHHVERDVLVITMNRPGKLNALTRAMRLRMAELIRSTAALGVRGVVLTGTDPAFSSGEDLADAAVTGPDSLIASMDTFHDITRAILETEVPVIAAVNGLAVGGAAELTVSCDGRIGSTAAEFMLPENRLGITISNGSSIFLPALLGARARHLVLGSPRLDATEAERIGLLDEVTDDVVAAAIDLALAWNPEGGSAALHLKLLRPTLADFEEAVIRENEIALDAWDRGYIQAGVERFWKQKQ